VPIAAAPKPLAEAGQQSPKELSVLMLPAELAGGSSLEGDPLGTPPDNDKKPPPEEPSPLIDRTSRSEVLSFSMDIGLRVMSHLPRMKTTTLVFRRYD